MLPRNCDGLVFLQIPEFPTAFPYTPTISSKAQHFAETSGWNISGTSICTQTFFANMMRQHLGTHDWSIKIVLLSCCCILFMVFIPHRTLKLSGSFTKSHSAVLFQILPRSVPGAFVTQLPLYKVGPHS